MNGQSSARKQSGLTYIEVMIAVVLLAIALVPAIEALHTGMVGADVQETASTTHYATLSRMEEMLAEPFGALVNAAATAGSETTPSSYSDAAGTPDRRLVFAALYDADNGDGDGNVFTVPDPDFDGDGNPYTGYTGLLWVRVEIEGTLMSLESLTAL